MRYFLDRLTFFVGNGMLKYCKRSFCTKNTLHEASEAKVNLVKYARLAAVFLKQYYNKALTSYFSKVCIVCGDLIDFFE